MNIGVRSESGLALLEAVIALAIVAIAASAALQAIRAHVGADRQALERFYTSAIAEYAYGELVLREERGLAGAPPRAASDSVVLKVPLAATTIERIGTPRVVAVIESERVGTGRFLLSVQAANDRFELAGELPRSRTAQ